MRSLAILIVLALPAAAAAAHPQRVRWEQSPQAFAGLHAIVTLTSGGKVEGHWAAVTPDSFTIDVTRTSDKRSIPKGMQTLPRAAIQQVRVGKRRVRGRIIGTAAGMYGATGIAALAGGNGESFQGPLIFAFFGAAALGYYVGKSFDHATHPVEFVP